MTSTAGFRVVTTPCCGSLILELAYRSINYSAQEHWTDGEATNSLAPTDCGLRRCSCGRFYVLREVDWGERIEGEIYLGQALTKGIRVADSDLDAVIESGPLTPLTEIAVRRRLWRNLNQGYRSVYRELKAKGHLSYPVFEPDVKQIHNMTRLLVLLQDEMNRNALEVAELYRELGQFREAVDLLGYVRLESGDQPLGRLITMLARELVRGPVRYRP